MGVRKNYVTKNEATKLLYSLKNKVIIDQEDCRMLEMIRICLIGDQKGLNLWGKSIEKTRPLFIESIEETNDAYENAYQRALKIAKEDA